MRARGGEGTSAAASRRSEPLLDAMTCAPEEAVERERGPPGHESPRCWPLESLLARVGGPPSPAIVCAKLRGVARKLLTQQIPAATCAWAVTKIVSKMKKCDHRVQSLSMIL